MFILKHFKNHENSKVACRKENDNQNFIENGIVSPKNSKDEGFGDLKLFKKNRNLGNYLQNEVWENLFQNQRGLEEREDDTWPLGYMHKAAMQNRSCLWVQMFL
ncbi:unnamed protein product, partial [Vitis vinifera]|uniref:Uncharacterized protein n=1 Tax=Vitis vinifera TaxID=29760 RepID=D7TEX6_VITVI